MKRESNTLEWYECNAHNVYIKMEIHLEFASSTCTNLGVKHYQSNYGTIIYVIWFE